MATRAQPPRPRAPLRRLRAAREPSTRERIHEAALGLFARYGFDGVTLQQVADEVGIHKSSLFHHYRSKLELAYEVFLEAMEDVAVAMEELAEREPLELDDLVDVLLALDDMFAERPAVARLIVSVILAPTDSDFNFSLRVDDAGNPVRRFLASLLDWLRRAREQGVVRADLSIRQATFNLMGLGLFYPAAAPEMSYLAGDAPFGKAARRVRRLELERTLRGLLAPG